MIKNYFIEFLRQIHWNKYAIALVTVFPETPPLPNDDMHMLIAWRIVGEFRYFLFEIAWCSGGECFALFL